MNTLIEYRKVLNTVPTLGGVKSAFHEAKQESVTNYETDNNSPHTRQVMNIVNFFVYTKNIKKQYWSQTVAFKGETRLQIIIFSNNSLSTFMVELCSHVKEYFLMYDSFH